MEQNQLVTLVEKSRAGDRQAQEALVREVQNRVYYHCKKMLKNEPDALDATQDVLIAMLTSLDKLRQPAAFWGWLNGITANRCKHLLTQGTKEWQIPEDEDGDSLLDSVETLDDQVVPDKALDNAETQRLIMEIIDDLPPEQKMSVLFFYYDEMNVKEIATAMEVSEGTVKSRLNYARRSIKAGVEKLAKKGTKLYGVSPLPFLAYFLRQSMAAQDTLSASAAGILTQGVLASAGTGASTAGAAAGTAAAVGAKATAGVSAKVIAGVVAGTLTVGGIGGAVYLATHREPEPSPTPAPVMAVVTPDPTPTPTPTPEVTPTPTPVPTEEPSPTPSPSEAPSPSPTPPPEPSPSPEASPTPEPTYTFQRGFMIDFVGNGYGLYWRGNELCIDLELENTAEGTATSIIIPAFDISTSDNGHKDILVISTDETPMSSDFTMPAHSKATYTYVFAPEQIKSLEMADAIARGEYKDNILTDIWIISGSAMIQDSPAAE